MKKRDPKRGSNYEPNWCDYVFLPFSADLLQFIRLRLN